MKPYRIVLHILPLKEHISAADSHKKPDPRHLHKNVRTPLVEGMAKQSDPENPERAIQAIADAVPLKRLADPEEVGELAAFLGCYESSYITGTQIVIDGGSTLPETTSMGQ